MLLTTARNRILKQPLVSQSQIPARTPKKDVMAAILNRTTPQRLNPAETGIKGFIKYWLPVIIYAIIIFQFSALPGKDVPELFAYQDLVFHTLEYAILAFLVNRAIKAYYPGQTYRKRFLLTLFLCVIYALSDEIHQAFVPYRDPSLVDIVYDSLGICIANILYR